MLRMENSDSTCSWPNLSDEKCNNISCSLIKIAGFSAAIAAGKRRRYDMSYVSDIIATSANPRYGGANSSSGA
jgi:hypothetical protein